MPAPGGAAGDVEDQQRPNGSGGKLWIALLVVFGVMGAMIYAAMREPEYTPEENYTGEQPDTTVFAEEQYLGMARDDYFIGNDTAWYWEYDAVNRVNRDENEELNSAINYYYSNPNFNIGILEELLGRHGFSLQWVSWEHPGEAYVRYIDGMLRIVGEQRNTENNSYVAIDGIIKYVDGKKFIFSGEIVTKAPFANNNMPCVREGEMAFVAPQNRRYWRLVDIDNPCSELVDYVDVFFD